MYVDHQSYVVLKADSYQAWGGPETPSAILIEAGPNWYLLDSTQNIQALDGPLESWALCYIKHQKGLVFQKWW